MHQQTKSDPSAPHPDAKWGNHKTHKHRTPESPILTPSGQTSTYFSGLKKYLLSIGTLCEHGCEATFNKKVHIKNKQSGRTIMRGTRDARTNLYMLSLTQQNNLMTESKTPDEYFAGSAYECKSKNTLVDYHHTSCWSPTHSVWGKAITKNFFTSWTGLSVYLVHKHIMKKNQPYLGTSSNRERSSDPHNKRSYI